MHVRVVKCQVCGRPCSSPEAAEACAQRDFRGMVCEIPHAPKQRLPRVRRPQKVGAR